jgi:dTDP-4-dehydrorhamnose 3,5-epimerase-like enzyme
LKPTHHLIELPERTDARGILTFGQEPDQIPFRVKRFFILHGVAPGATRGAHAHRRQHQLFVMLAGAATVTIDDGDSRSVVRLDRPNRALHAPPMLWLELHDFTPGAVCIVLTSDLYSELDYIRDRQEFLQLAGEEPGP